MRGKDIIYVSVAVVLLVLAFGVGRLSAAEPLAPSGDLDSPGPPSSTTSYTLEDIYNRLDAGTAGSQTTFTEPSSGPTAGTGHTLDEIMAKAPAADNTNGAVPSQVLTGKTYWSLRTDGTWGTQTGTMPDRGQVTLLPTTTDVPIAAGYHNGSGFVHGDSDLVASNIKDGIDIFGVTGTYPTAAVPKTGQTQCYTTTSGSQTTCPATGYLGQDGEYQKGVAWPNPRFTDNGNGTVTDNLTGLIWLKDANCIQTQYPGFDTDNTAGDGQVTWEHALAFVAGINAGTYSNCGASSTDWRLPNVKELHGLIHYGLYSPALPNTAGTGQWASGDPFTGVQSSYYWSSTTYAYDTSYAWHLDLNVGIKNNNTKTSTDYVWPVRGGQ